MGNPVIGIQTSVAIGVETVPGTRVAVTDHMDLISENLDYIPVLHRIRPTPGKRVANAAYEFISHNDGGGAFVIRGRHAYMGDLLLAILGAGDGSALTPFVPIHDNVDLSSYTIECIKANSVAEVVLTGAKFNSMTFRSSTNEPLEIECNVISMAGIRDSGDLTAFADTAWIDAIPLIHSRMSIAATAEAWLGGATGPEARSLEFTFNNNLDPEGWTNSQTRKIIPVGLFDLEGSMEIPFNVTSAGFWAKLVAAAVVSFAVEYSDGTNTTTFTFKVKLDGEFPGITGPENVWLTLNFHGVLDSTNEPVSVVLA